MVITFAGALRQACVHLNAELFSCIECTHAAAGGTLNTVDPLLTVTVARSRFVSTSVAIIFTVLNTEKKNDHRQNCECACVLCTEENWPEARP